jgi:ABC-2 type transport system permease protein
MKQVLTVLKFEYTTFVKSGAFIGMTIFMILLGLIAPTVPTVISLSRQEGSFLQSIFGGDEKYAAIVDTGNMFTDTELEGYLKHGVKRYDTAEAAQQAVTEGECDFGVELLGYSYTLYVKSMEISTYETQGDIEGLLRRKYQLEKMGDAGISESDTLALLEYSPEGELITVSSSEESSDDYMENMVYAYAIVFLLYFALIACGNYVLTTVIREKTTKAMELLVTSCKSWKLIHGKVLGVGLAGLTQFSLLVITALVSMAVNAALMVSAMDTEAITEVVAAAGAIAVDTGFSVAVKPELLMLMVIFFLLGFFVYAYLYAGLASTVDRMEDANSVVQLPIFLIIGSFLAAMMGLLSPGATWVTVLSYVPFFTPMVMFMRICLGTAGAWEIMLSIVLQFITIIAVGWISAKIYRMGTLMYGKKLSVKEIAKAIVS